MQLNEIKPGDYINILDDKYTIICLVSYIYYTDTNCYIDCKLTHTYDGINLIGLRIDHKFFIPLKDFNSIVSKPNKHSIKLFNKNTKRIKDYLNQYFLS